MKQTTFASVAWEKKGKITRRERFLAEMDAVIPWSRLLALIEPHYPKAGNGTQPKPMEQMLRIYFMQNWFNLSDPQAEDSLYDIESMRRFAGLELAEDAIPDESTILRFRHLLEKHQLTAQIFAQIRTLLEEKRLLLRSGTIVDATIIAAPPSTKNAAEARDPEMHQTKKGKDWHFGMKAHVGTDRRGIVHSLSTTAANVSDISQLPKLLHGQEKEIRPTGASSTASAPKSPASVTG
jgi:IS5 family transposase